MCVIMISSQIYATFWPFHVQSGVEDSHFAVSLPKSVFLKLRLWQRMRQKPLFWNPKTSNREETAWNFFEHSFPAVMSCLSPFSGRLIPIVLHFLSKYMLSQRLSASPRPNDWFCSRIETASAEHARIVFRYINTKQNFCWSQKKSTREISRFSPSKIFPHFRKIWVKI